MGEGGDWGLKGEPPPHIISLEVLGRSLTWRGNTCRHAGRGQAPPSTGPGLGIYIDVDRLAARPAREHRKGIRQYWEEVPRQGQV